MPRIKSFLQFSAQHVFFACRGLIKILSVAAVVLWYCRIRHRSLQDFRLACFEYKYFILQEFSDFFVSFPRVQSWKGFQARWCHLFAAIKVSVHISQLWSLWTGFLWLQTGKLSLSDSGGMRSFVDVPQADATKGEKQDLANHLCFHRHEDACCLRKDYSNGFSTLSRSFKSANMFGFHQVVRTIRW